MMAGLQQMPSNAKEVLHESMHGQELLRLSRRFKLPHLSFPMSRRLMRDFGSIVSVLVGVVDDGGHDLAVSGAVAFQLVGDQPPGRASLPLQQLAEESFGGFPITARLDEDIEHITILIYRAPEVLAFALYLYENLVQVPRVTETTLSTLQSPSVFRPELDTPKSDRFIGNGDAALSQEILDIAKAQAKSVVQPDRVADDFGRKSISAVARRVPFHPPSLSDASPI